MLIVIVALILVICILEHVSYTACAAGLYAAYNDCCVRLKSLFTVCRILDMSDCGFTSDLPTGLSALSSLRYVFRRPSRHNVGIAGFFIPIHSTGNEKC
jgi:hypothetical protein